MPTTIAQVATDANALYTALASDLSINFDLPELTLPTDFEMPTDVIIDPVTPLTIEQLTTKSVDGTGVFDAMMAAVTAHLSEQHSKNRITGADYAKVYMGSISASMQFAVQFLLGKDRVYLENLQLREAITLAQAQTVRAKADIQIAKAQIQQMAYATIDSRLKAYTSRNAYALSKMELVTGYESILSKEAEISLTLEQVDVARAQTKDTLTTGQPVLGVVSLDKQLKEAQALTAQEQLDVARAQTKDTLLDGGPIGGIVAIDKAYKEAQQVHMENQGTLILEQVQATRAQTRDTLTTGEGVSGLLGIEKLIKLAQRDLTEEQVDVARAQTWETHADGSAILGIAKFEKELKQAQSKLVLEQYESQRGQTRGTLSTGETVIGLIGAQTLLYNQQVTSYKRDAESKGLKMLLDTWVTRKTIDEGVAVPSSIDVAAINTAMTTYVGNLDL